MTIICSALHQVVTQPTKGGIGMAWSPCTWGKSIDEFINRLSLPVFYEDLREHWQSLGSPYLDALHWPNISEHHYGNLSDLVAAQQSSLYFALDNHVRLGTPAPPKTFEEAALYVFNRSSIMAELKVREYGWSDEVKEVLMQAYWKQMLASLDVDRAPCLFAGAHKCLLEMIWGEIVTMSTDEILSRFQHLFRLEEVAYKANTSPSSLSTSNASTQSLEHAAFFDSDPYQHTLKLFEPFTCWQNSQEEIQFPLNERSLGLENLKLSRPLQQDVNSKQDVELTFFSSSSFSTTTGGNIFSKSEAIERCKTPMLMDRIPKRREMRRRATDEGKSRNQNSSKKKKDTRDTLVFDMTARLHDTFTRFDKGKHGNAELHSQLRNILECSHDDEGNSKPHVKSKSSAETSGTQSGKEKKRSSKRGVSLDYDFKEEAFIEKISKIARLLNAISPEVPSREVVDLSGKDMQLFASDSIVRYQHALLDTWHLYRGRWEDLVEMEQKSASAEHTADMPIKVLVEALKARV